MNGDGRHSANESGKSPSCDCTRTLNHTTQKINGQIDNRRPTQQTKECKDEKEKDKRIQTKENRQYTTNTAKIKCKDHKKPRKQTKKKYHQPKKSAMKRTKKHIEYT